MQKVSCEKKIKEIENYVSLNYSATDCGLTEECSMGNYSDVFSDGYSCGYSMALYKIATILGIEVEEPHDQEYGW